MTLPGGLKISAPAEPIANNYLFALGFNFPVLKEVNQQLALAGLVEQDIRQGRSFSA
ncbi:hypothetical protein JWJ90_22035 [Desulfobulbus rhabdoformis]|jgi:hypothetical protein|uniref:hypothetical protein n=1 Tax=Desulfobulbus rhabdoformis TaxID=34032 RepID=UPI0019669676|nr:hypothetical protein [Desulfobulbus rhabdoformis]MBM9616946.1 hypothetical protein [Desulfobulbus rhabdoformis]